MCLQLSGGQRQALAIARAAAWCRRVLLLDEPTSALGVEQQREVLDLIRRIRAQGVAIVLVSHQMQDVVSVCDCVTVLRLGEVVATLTKEDITVDNLIGFITGARSHADGKTAIQGGVLVSSEPQVSRCRRPGPRPRSERHGHRLAGVRDSRGCDRTGSSGLVLIVAVFSLASGSFLTQANWLNTSSTATEVMLLAVGETFVIVSGGIDLSVGATLGLSGMVGAWVDGSLLRHQRHSRRHCDRDRHRRGHLRRCVGWRRERRAHRPL